MMMDRNWNLWGAFASQLRDLADNDNMSPLMQMRAAQDLEKWAAMRSEWGGLAHLAAAQAQDMRASARRRMS